MQMYPPSGQQKFWLIKTESLGCDSASCAATVGIKDYTFSEQTINLFPNPSNGLIIIETDDPNKIDYVTITTITGAEKIRETVLEKKKYINTSDLPQGVFFVNFYRDNKIIVVKKLIKE
jgi:hypothetical protein